MKFMGLMYSYLNISMSDSVVPDEIKGREVRHLFPMTFFQVEVAICLLCVLVFVPVVVLYYCIVKSRMR